MKRDLDIRIVARARPVLRAVLGGDGLCAFSPAPGTPDVIPPTASSGRNHSRHRFHPGLTEQWAVRISVPSATTPRLLPRILLILLLPALWFVLPQVAHAEDDLAKRYQNYREYVGSGEAALKKGDYAIAIESLTKAIAMSPFEAGNYYSRGIAYHKSGKEEAAIGDFDRVIVLKPRMSAALVYRGLCNERLERFGEAVKDYNAALQISPKDPSIHNNLAWLYLTAKDEKCRDAIKALEHAVKAAAFSEERNAQVLDTLARAYFVNGRPDEAAETQKKALKLEPGNNQFKASLKAYEDSLGRSGATGKPSTADNPR